MNNEIIHKVLIWNSDMTRDNNIIKSLQADKIKKIISMLPDFLIGNDIRHQEQYVVGVIFEDNNWWISLNDYNFYKQLFNYPYPDYVMGHDPYMKEDDEDALLLLCEII